MLIAEVATQLKNGIHEIASRHRQVIDYHHQMETLIAGGKEDFALLESVLDGLIEYTISCFDFEEQMMSLAAYPGLDEHVRSHEMFMRRLSGYRSSVRSGKYAANELMSLLKIWVGVHINGQDADFINVVKQGYGVA